MVDERSVRASLSSTSRFPRSVLAFPSVQIITFEISRDSRSGLYCFQKNYKSYSVQITSQLIQLKLSSAAILTKKRHNVVKFKFSLYSNECKLLQGNYMFTLSTEKEPEMLTKVNKLNFIFKKRKYQWPSLCGITESFSVNFICLCVCTCVINTFSVQELCWI